MVFVVNLGDFAEASSWSCELTHPTHKPALALHYLFEKYVYAFTPRDGSVPPGLRVPPGDLPQELQVFLSGKAEKVLFAWYADMAEEADATLRQSRRAKQLAMLRGAGAKNILSVAEDVRWSAALYRDDIHPTPEGNRVLAGIIRDGLVRRGMVVDQ